MLKLSKKSEYALMAARYMAIKNHGNAVTAKEIAESYKISFELVSKVLQNLAKNNIANKSGYTLKKTPNEATIIELEETVETYYQSTDCLRTESPKNECSYSDCCKIRDPLAEIQKKIDKVFYETKLAHII